MKIGATKCEKFMRAAYISAMKVKVSITLSSNVLAKVDRHTGSKVSRLAYIDNVLRAYFQERDRRKMHARDLDRINDAAARLNSEAEDVLTYQVLKD